MSEPLTPAQRRTLSAREALAAKFNSPQEKSAYYRQLACRANSGRLVLSATEVAALGDAYALLGRIASRIPTLNDLNTEAA